MTSPIKVRFQDCDPFHHLNNSKYIDYFLNVREDQILENYDLNVFDIKKNQGKAWVVSSNQIAYFKPAYMLETVMVKTKLIHYTDKDLLVEMKMLDKSESQLKALLWAKFTHFDVVNKVSAEHSNSLMDLFKSVVLPVEQRSFEERCTAIVQVMKKI